MLKKGNEYNNTEFLLLKFNERDKMSFSTIYIQIFDELNHFAERLFYSTPIESEDLIQDIFINIWSNSKLTFLSIDHIKNYIYLCIKNKHKDFLKHQIRAENHHEQMKHLEDYQFSIMIETEAISILTMADNILPDECAKVLKLYIDGYDVKEIAEKLGKSQNTVYHQKNEAINILKKHTISKKITFILNFLAFI